LIFAAATMPIDFSPPCRDACYALRDARCAMIPPSPRRCLRRRHAAGCHCAAPACLIAADAIFDTPRCRFHFFMLLLPISLFAFISRFHSIDFFFFIIIFS
jgi:hypothetical protein